MALEFVRVERSQSVALEVDSSKDPEEVEWAVLLVLIPLLQFAPNSMTKGIDCLWVCPHAHRVAGDLVVKRGVQMVYNATNHVRVDARVAAKKVTHVHEREPFAHLVKQHEKTLLSCEYCSSLRRSELLWDTQKVHQST